jgi:predicted dehydrogenase
MKVAVLSFAHERAATYARLLRDMPGVDLLTADSGGPPGDPARGRAVAERLGVSYVDTWDEVFEWCPEAVVVTSEVDQRRELVERAAEGEAYVLCEQPLATKEADAKAMVDACDIGGVRLTLASPACFGEAFAVVRRGIAGGALGTLSTIHGAYHASIATVDGGALGACAPVLLDLVDVVLDGEPASQVYAQVNSVLSGQPNVESAALVTVRYPSGTVVSVDCGASLSGASGPAMTFVGDRASVEYDATPRLLGGFDAAAGGERWEPGGADLYAAMLTDFVAAFESGEGTGPDSETALRTLRIVQAAYESADTGQPVDIG